MSWNRFAFLAMIWGGLITARATDVPGAVAMYEQGLPAVLVYLVGSIVLFAHILYAPAVSPARRICAIVLDVSILTYAAVVCGESACFFYPLFLWTILGNGFRFGVPYLFGTMLFASALFTGVLAGTGYLYEHTGLSVGLIVGMIMLPTYVSRLIKKLSEAKQQAEAASRAKTQFLASVSHELRTPLNAIIGLSDLLHTAKLPEEEDGMARTIGTAGRSLLTLIDTILDYTRADEHRAPMTIASFDLFALLRHVHAMLSVQTTAKDLLLLLHVTPQVPRFVVGHRGHLEEIIINIVSNAIKFTHQGHVGLSIDAVREGPDLMRLRFEVSDTGIGIAAEAQGRIFESFTQADDSIIDRFGGTGLGLAICKQLIEQYGGSIGVESTLGVGSLFWFELTLQTEVDAEEAGEKPDVLVVSRDPLLHAACAMIARTSVAAVDGDVAALLRSLPDPTAVLVLDGRMSLDPAAIEALLTGVPGRSSRRPAVLVVDEILNGLPSSQVRRTFSSAVGRPFQAAELAAACRAALILPNAQMNAQESDKIATEPAVRPLDVLVAEDNATNQIVIRKILELVGHRVTVVRDGEGALDHLREGRFDVVLMDVNMPRMNGIEATKLYRFASLGRPRVPIVALTADASAETSARCLDAGMSACARKPIEARALLRIIDEVTGQDMTVRSRVPDQQADALTVSTTNTATDANDLPLCYDTVFELERLGGRGFVVQLFNQFFKDVEKAEAALLEAVAAHDVAAFQDQAHSLRSAAGNVGLSSIYALCLSWREISPRQLSRDGELLVERLRLAVETARPHYDQYCAMQPLPRAS